MTGDTTSDPAESDTEHPIVAYLAVEAAGIVERFNDDFGDAVLFVARALSAHPEATDARIVSIDQYGIDTEVTDAEGTRIVRIEFAVDVVVPDHLTEALFELLERARTASGEEGRTSAEEEMAALASIRTHLTSVVAVTDINPHLRQVTLGGGDLATTFEPLGPDCFFYVLLPPPGRDELTIDQSFTWEAHALMPPDEQPVGAYYTLRAWRPDVAELDMWMVLHDDGHPGHASSWAARAKPGDPVALWGPRTAFHPPADTEHLVLVADETGLPAMAGVLDWMPDGMTATVVAEVADESERQALPARPGVEVIWCHRGSTPAGETTLLVDAVRELPAFTKPTYVFGGGESKAMTAVRRHVRDERGLPREATGLIAYWRHRATTDAEVEHDA